MKKRKTYQELIIHFLKLMTNEADMRIVDTYLNIIRPILAPFTIIQQDFTNRTTLLTTQRDNALEDVTLAIEADDVFHNYWEECIKTTYDILALHNLLPRDMINPYHQKEEPKRYQKDTNGKYNYHLRNSSTKPTIRSQ